MQNELAVFFILGTPAIAVIGALAATIMKIRGRQRLAELAYRERMAAIERGADLAALPPLPILAAPASAERTARGLIIGGILSLAIAIGLPPMLLLLPASDGREAWPVAFLPFFIGLALLISARVVRGGAR